MRIQLGRAGTGLALVQVGTRYGRCRWQLVRALGLSAEQKPHRRTSLAHSAVQAASMHAATAQPYACVQGQCQA